MGLAVVGPPACHDLTAGVRNEERLFELSRPEAVGSYRSPFVWPLLVTPGALRDHGLDGETVTWFHYSDSLVFWNIYGNVNNVVNKLFNLYMMPRVIWR